MWSWSVCREHTLIRPRNAKAKLSFPFPLLWVKGISYLAVVRVEVEHIGRTGGSQHRIWAIWSRKISLHPLNQPKPAFPHVQLCCGAHAPFGLMCLTRILWWARDGSLQLSAWLHHESPKTLTLPCTLIRPVSATGIRSKSSRTPAQTEDQPISRNPLSSIHGDWTITRFSGYLSWYSYCWTSTTSYKPRSKKFYIWIFFHCSL